MITDRFGVFTRFAVFPSKDWKDSVSDRYGAAEGHAEAYYRLQLNRHLAISPDIQLIWNPDGASKSSEGDNDPILCVEQELR